MSRVLTVQVLPMQEPQSTQTCGPAAPSHSPAAPEVPEKAAYPLVAPLHRPYPRPRWAGER